MFTLLENMLAAVLYFTIFYKARLSLVSRFLWYAKPKVAGGYFQTGVNFFGLRNYL